ncbi:hypothetical protein HMPREF9946_02622 [Acetobacteraceae bacterium AT-5844]|nr:hypothetical protein HMPREF9946_02622 [Acetobacteraceae bacterium AT-5844]
MASPSGVTVWLGSPNLKLEEKDEGGLEGEFFLPPVPAASKDP